jgi:hypothetical protein
MASVDAGSREDVVSVAVEGRRRERSWEMAVGTDMYRGGSKIFLPLRASLARAPPEDGGNEPCEVLFTLLFHFDVQQT